MKPFGRPCPRVLRTDLAENLRQVIAGSRSANIFLAWVTDWRPTRRSGLNRRAYVETSLAAVL